MTRDEIIRMATEAGFQPPILKELWTQGYLCIVEATQIERFADLVAAHEREACAKVCEQDEFQIYETAERCAAAIRARSDNGSH